MTSPAFLARYALLLWLCLLSLSLHVLAIAWIDPRPVRPPVGADASAMAVHLVDATAALPAPQPQPRPAPPAPAATPAPAPAPRQAEPASAAEPAPAAATAPGNTSTPPAPAPAERSRAYPSVPARLPGHYRTAVADSARIDYRVTSTSAGGDDRDEGQARLIWDSDGSDYRLELDGVLGEMVSEGGLDDAGIAPRRLRETLGVGQATTVFDRSNGEISDSLGARAPQQLVPGSQDLATVLLQLGGIGKFDPDQLGSVAEFWVGAMGGARIERFEVQGRERIETGIGALETVRLLRLEEDERAPLLEVWLAPDRHWLPVQLRITTPDGAMRTQTLAAIDMAPQQKPAAHAVD